MNRALLAFSVFPLAVNLASGQSSPLRVGGDVKPPQKVKDAPPIYPIEAKLFGIEGIVIPETSIREDGSVGEIRVLRSIRLLDWGAAATVQQWRYEPTLLNGEPTPIVMTVTINYSLGKASSAVRREGEALLADLHEGEDEEEATWPSGRPELELSNYSLEVSEDGSRTYKGTVRNVSGSPLSNLRAVVVHRERFRMNEREREALRPTIQVIGPLAKDAEQDFTLHTPNDGSTKLEKILLLFTTRSDPMVQHLVRTRARGGVLGPRE